MGGICYAQAVDPLVLPEAFGIKISPNGNVVISQTADGSSLLYDWQTNDVYFYEEVYPGLGNCFSDETGMFVGETVEGVAKVMVKGKMETPPSIQKYTLSSLSAITNDGTRACGYVQSLELTQKTGLMYQPVFYDISPDGTFSDPVFLPTPEKDFFGARPQYCTATWISNDGNTMIGVMMDDRGFYTVPIVYTCDNNGTWSYSLPTRSLFNPKGLELPPSVDSFDEAFPDLVFPEITNFMTPEHRAEFDADWGTYQQTGDSDINPYDHLDLYMTQEEYDAYVESVTIWNNAVREYYKLYEDYEKTVSSILEGSVFFAGNSMALNSDGSKFVISAASYNANGDESLGNMYIIGTADGSLEPLKTSIRGVAPKQFLPDGTIVAASGMANPMAGSIKPCQSYVMPAGASDFMPVEDFIATLNPGYAQWMQDNLYVLAPTGYDRFGNITYGEMMLSGNVSFSDDFNVISGGVESWVNDDAYDYQYFTYIMTDAMAGIESIVDENKDGVYKVFNLNGMSVMTTTDKTELNNLGKGIYIINGKKVAITK